MVGSNHVLEKSSFAPATTSPACGILPDASVIHWVIKWGGESSLRLLRLCSFVRRVRERRGHRAGSVFLLVSKIIEAGLPRPPFTKRLRRACAITDGSRERT